jgi:hypothetical protein
MSEYSLDYLTDFAIVPPFPTIISSDALLSSGEKFSERSKHDADKAILDRL